jgi:hypothetical protein
LPVTDSTAHSSMTKKKCLITLTPDGKTLRENERGLGEAQVRLQAQNPGGPRHREDQQRHEQHGRPRHRHPATDHLQPVEREPTSQLQPYITR